MSCVCSLGPAARTPPGAAGSTAAQHGATVQQEQPNAAAPAPAHVTAADTICARATILAHAAAVQRVDDAMSAAVAGFKQQVLTPWLTNERQWAQAWLSMLQDLDTV